MVPQIPPTSPPAYKQDWLLFESGFYGIYIIIYCMYVYLQKLDNELGPFARTSSLDDNAANLINVIQEAYNVSANPACTMYT